jgi:uncharacterized protein YecT (DUF1311 family)
MRALIFAIAALVLAGAAHAAPSGPIDARVLCLKSASDNGRDPSRCVGVVYAACMKAPNAAEADCNARELAVWQGVLDDAWKLAKPLLAAYPDVARDQTDAQALWLKYRDKSCAIADKVDPGTMPGGSAACRARETAARVVDLRGIIYSLSEH